MKFIVLNLFFLLLSTSSCVKESIQLSHKTADDNHMSLGNPNGSKPMSYEMADNHHMLLGNPDDSRPSELFPNKYLIDKTYYWVSYNNSSLNFFNTLIIS